MTTGVIFLIGYAFQTFGLRYTGAGRAAFITGLSTIMVPLILVLLFHERLKMRPVIGALLATCGMAVLGIEGAAQGSLLGDLLVLGGAASFAVHIILTGRWGKGCDPVLFTLLQVIAVVPLALLGAVIWESPIPALQPNTMGAAAFTGLIVTGVGLLVQVWAQRITSPTHTAVIFASEPVFGAIFGFILAGELITQAGFVGSALILGGMFVAESG
jgi:drug/metabolite transporter (DMT)-like permease